MAGHEAGDDFSDGDFDNISHDALAELENTAIQFTQAQRPAGPAAASSDYGDDFEDDNLDDAVVIDESRSTPAVNPTFQRARTPQITQREQFQPRPAQSNHLASRQRPNVPLPPRFDQPAQSQPSVPIPQNDSMIVEQGSHPPPGPDHQVDNLQRQIEELIRERNALKDDVNAKAGEIAIVRNKQEKTIKEYERELVAVRKLSEDKLGRQKKELDAARISERKAATERDFYKQDIAEAERARKVKGPKTDGANITTPKKKKPFSHRDGFDDDEIEMLSPSKNSPSKLRRTTSSPSKPGKRKRKAVESPAGALEVINLEEPPIEQNKQPILDEAILKRLAIQDDRFDFLGTMLDHRVDSEHLRTIEELGKYVLPSTPAESFQSIILGKLPTLGYRKPTSDLPIEFCDVIISLWSKCLDEKYLQPIYLFVDILTLALELKTTAIAPHIIDTLVPLIQSTVDPVVVSRFSNKTMAKPFDKHICFTTPYFSLLHLTALGCMCEHQYIVRFWKLMRYDMTIMLFGSEQLMADTKLMISLLSTSVFRDSFGSPLGDEAEDPLIYGNVINRLTRLLVEVPNRPQSTEPLEPEAVYLLRLQILQLLTGMTRSPFASKFIAMHRDAIGRIVELVSDELDVLYDYKPDREESSRIISLATRLLYHLVTKHDDIIDMQKKLSVIHGGNQKYLLCLARLNFSEDDLVLESGIDPDVAACALEMLELVVTPEEGDAIHSAFSSL